MRYAFVYSALVACVSAHGVVTSITGANGVVMPGLSSTSPLMPETYLIPQAAHFYRRAPC